MIIKGHTCSRCIESTCTLDNKWSQTATASVKQIDFDI